MRRFQPSQHSAVPQALNGPVLIAQTNPEEKKSGKSLSMKLYGLAGLIGSPVAMAVSYKRNKSIPWAFVSGLVWPAYLIYTQVVDK